MFEKILLDIGKNPSKGIYQGTIVVCFEYNWEVWGNATLVKLCNLYTQLSLATVFAAFKLTQNCYVNMNTSFYLFIFYFLENWQNNHKLGSPLSFISMPRLKDYFHI